VDYNTESQAQYNAAFQPTLANSPNAIFRTDIQKMFIKVSMGGTFFIYNNVLYITKPQGAADQVSVAVGSPIRKADGFQTIFDKKQSQDLMPNNLFLDIVKDGVSQCVIQLKQTTIDQEPNKIQGIAPNGDLVPRSYNISYYGFDLADNKNRIVRGTFPTSLGRYDLYLKDKTKCLQPCVYKIEKDGPTKCKEDNGDGSTCSNVETVSVNYIKDPSSPPNCTGSPPASQTYNCKGNIEKCDIDKNVAKCDRAKEKYITLYPGRQLRPDTAWDHYLKIGSYEGTQWPSNECNCKPGQWSTCPACGPEGTQKTRTVTPAQEGGECSEEDSATTQACDIPTCDSQCTITDWRNAPGATCQPDTATCGKGAGKIQQIKTYTEASGFAGACNGKTEETRHQPCDLPDCVTGCTDDTTWQLGQCSVSCGGGTRTKTKTTRTPNADRTRCITNQITETEPCNLQACTDCSNGEWRTDNRCVAVNGGNCGPGKITWTRTVNQPGPGGRQCTPEQLTTTRTTDCDLGTCNVDCQYTWSEWSSCSTTCDTATQKGVQTRRPVGPNGQGAPVQPRGNGAQCPAPQERPCQPANKVCPIDCSVKKDWYDAPGERCLPDPAKGKNCGKGNGRIRQLRELNPANETGSCNLESERYVTCDLPECPVDCVIGPWTPDVNQCSAITGKKCGESVTMEQKRTITPAKFGGQCVDPESKMAIPPDTTTQSKTINCGLGKCGTKCIPGPWMAWGACQGKCDQGVRKRTRTVEQTVADLPNVGCSPEELRVEESEACPLKPCVGPTQLYEIRRGKGFDLPQFDLQGKASRVISFSTRLR
jgi:hypothetical protein